MNIVICDDQKEYTDTIERLIDKYMPIEIKYSTNVFSSGEEFIDFFEKDNKVDILFMDIEMDKISGIEAVKQLREKYANTIVFFITSYSSYMSDLFRLNTFQFIKKPIDEKMFEYDFLRAIETYKNLHNKIRIKVGVCEELFLEYSNIVYIDVNARKITIHTLDKSYIISGNLRQYNDELIPFGFANPHKSYLVNLLYVSMIGKNIVELGNIKEKLPISRGYRENFLKRFKSFSMERVI